MNLRRWFQEHSLKLLAIRDTPEAIAGGVAIGIFFGFTPLFGLKTIGAIFLAWVTRSNILAAVLAGAMHDLVLPFMPVVYIWEWKIGYWILHNEWPQRLSAVRIKLSEWRSWTALLHGTTFITVGKPLLLGSAICAVPVAAIAYFITRAVVARHQAHRKAATAPVSNPPNA